jgi:pimeloyl-ACP methyl ester carboxylesterase
MAVARVNGVDLYYEVHGAGQSLVLVHGSWMDATTWRRVVPGLAESFRLLVYDRRGHSRSERTETQGSLDEDGDDLAALLEHLDLAPAHVVGSSVGGIIALRLATRRPDLFLSLTCHEPPLWGLLGNDTESRPLLAQAARSVESIGRQIAAGDHAGAARQFVEEVTAGPGAWDGLVPAEVKEVMIRNAPTFLDELRDPTQVTIEEDSLTRIEIPVRLTLGSTSPPLFPRVIDRLECLIPHAVREVIEGAAHAPHLTTARAYVELTKQALESRS